MTGVMGMVKVTGMMERMGVMGITGVMGMIKMTGVMGVIKVSGVLGMMGMTIEPPELGVQDRVQPLSGLGFRSNPLHGGGGPSILVTPPTLQTKLPLQRRGFSPAAELMELRRLPNPSQLNKCLDWELTHLNETIWKVLMER